MFWSLRACKETVDKHDDADKNNNSETCPFNLCADLCYLSPDLVPVGLIVCPSMPRFTVNKPSHRRWPGTKNASPDMTADGAVGNDGIETDR